MRDVIRLLRFATLALVLAIGAGTANGFWGGVVGPAPSSVTLYNFNGLDGSSTPSDTSQVAYWDSTWSKISGMDGSILQCDNSDGSTKPNCPAHKFIFYTEDWSTGFNIGTAGKTWGGFLAYETSNFKSGDPINRGAVITSTQFSLCTPSGGGIYPDCQELQVLYNVSTGLYVGWFTTYQSTGVVGIEVVTCPTPFFYGNGTGGSGCTISAPATFGGATLIKPIGTIAFLQRSDGVAFVAANDGGVAAPGNFNVRIWKLNSSYTDTTGSPSSIIVDQVEAVGLFERAGTAYVTWGALCAYCNGTPMYYATAPASDNLQSATWTIGGSISAYSCGGQPFQVNTVWLNGGNEYLFTPLRYRAPLSTLDTNPGYFNQGLSNFSLAELSFAGSAISSLDPCPSSVTIVGLPDTAPPSPPTGAIEQDYVIGGVAPSYNDWGNAGAQLHVGQVFTAQSSGSRGSITFPAFQACSGITSNNNCDATRSGGASTLTVTIAPWTGTAPGAALCSGNISSAALPHVAKDSNVSCSWTAVANNQYIWYLSGNNDATTGGGFGWVYDDHNTLHSIDANAKAVLSADGVTWTAMTNSVGGGSRSLRFAIGP
jgi:hypothetical protein